MEETNKGGLAATLRMKCTLQQPQFSLALGPW